MLYQQLSFIWQRNLINNVRDKPFNRKVKSSVRNLHSIELLEYLLKGSCKAVVGENTDCFNASHLGNVFHMQAAQLLRKSLAQVFIKQETSSEDLVAILVCKNKVEELWRPKLALENHSRRKAEVGDACWKGVVMPVLTLRWVSVKHPGPQSALHHISGA